MPSLNAKERLELRTKYFRYPFFLFLVTLVTSITLEILEVIAKEDTFTVLIGALGIVGLFDLYFCIVYKISQTGIFSFSPEKNIISFSIRTLFSLLLVITCTYYSLA